ncbi:SDR family NAD(P)-dependent oxidoreductase [Thermomonospora cellulosilytica]|uniref:NAD(P)-dependent dehydrogenase (Short-subunit alcohol dehydrogenase family) n=1 Tax=Thermomonospora cellulosilytica TaxID=1411118 RepID=A0A7W3N0Q2_9ACTN|nr:SDR family NAD(P)-dependent oxidoreductase [Thermomonospora cellulosilytica]MBA9005394.1 NAD(P)-dependent dehydrogenase (short-subunit alcohol dehydrogenase family) [Thermomonospora cellulosilytica]
MTDVAIITGAAGGIGAATARRLAATGTRCVLVDSDPLVEKVAVDVDGFAVVGDPSDPDLSTKAVAYAGDGLDALVLNAGIGCAGWDPAMLDLRGYRSAVGLTQHAVVYGLRAAIPVMRRRGGGSIVVTASFAGPVSDRHDPLSMMTAYAVAGLVRAFARPLAREGIRLSLVCPGRDEEIGDDGVLGNVLPSADEMAAVVEDALRAADPGARLVVRPGMAPVPLAPVPLH